jgi:hypothetical protein
MAVAQRKMETFNSIKYLKLLKNSGMTEQQTEIQIQMVQEANQSGLDHLATKEDLSKTEFTLKEDFRKTEFALKEDIHKLEKQINHSKWQTLAGIVALGFIVLGNIFSKHMGA